MRFIRVIVLLLLSCGVALAGFPVQAPQVFAAPKMPIHQMAMQDMQQGQDCGGCPNTEKYQDESGCPAGSGAGGACAAPCVTSGCASLSVAGKAGLPRHSGQTARFYYTDMVLASRLLDTQDRPPKPLA